MRQGGRSGVAPLLAGLLIFLSAGSCQKRETGKVWVMPADLACATDDDCTIRKMNFDCCCECDACASDQPFAISKRANTAWDARCAGAMCTMEACLDPAGHRVEDFRAVCVNHACERRAKG